MERARETPAESDRHEREQLESAQVRLREAQRRIGALKAEHDSLHEQKKSLSKTLGGALEDRRVLDRGALRRSLPDSVELERTPGFWDKHPVLLVLTGLTIFALGLALEVLLR